MVYVMSKYQYILLDWDGNIAKTLEMWLSCCQFVLKERGVDVADKEVARHFSTLIELLEKHGVEDSRAALDTAQARAIKLSENIGLYPDVIDTLMELKKIDRITALITSSPRPTIEMQLKNNGLDQYFSSVVTQNEANNHKPHPEPLEIAMEEIGAKKSTTIMVGDSTPDIEAANAAGIDSVLFYPPEHDLFYDKDDLLAHNPTHVIEKFSDLLKIIN